ncbi:hypothetical protein VL763_08800 [Listeria seeligeri]|uniref:hypothetical protein n=1 Tax=Listeria seeligeri TaxID=1640 RepID=UPI001E30F89D|nr:hypothetical protein [Listeria seeligeri]
MEINAEQVYTLNFTMRLRLDPLQNKKLLKLSILVILFFNWAQRDFLGELSGYFGSTKLNLILIAIAMLFYLILSPKKLTVRFQAAQYLLSICCLQGVSFTVAKFFYVLFFYTLQQETYIDAKIISIAYAVFLILWLIFFVSSCLYFRKRLIRGDFRENSETQKKRSDGRITLSRKSLILILGFFVLFLVMCIIGEDMAYIIFLIVILGALAGVTVFPEHLLTAYCKFKFKEFHVEVYGEIEEEGFQFEHCLTYRTQHTLESWYFPIEDLQKITIDNNIQQTGPIFFLIKKPFKKKKYYEFKYYVPINQKEELASDLFGYESIKVERALKTRDTEDVDLQYMQKRMKKYTKEMRWKINQNELFGFIINNSDEVGFDFYVPLVKR